MASPPAIVRLPQRAPVIISMPEPPAGSGGDAAAAAPTVTFFEETEVAQDAEAKAVRMALLEVIRVRGDTSTYTQELLSTLRKSRLSQSLGTSFGGVSLVPTAVDFGHLEPVRVGAPAAAAVVRSVQITNSLRRSVNVVVAVPPIGSNILQYAVRLGTDAAQAERVIVIQDGSWLLPPNQTVSINVEAYVGLKTGAKSNSMGRDSVTRLTCAMRVDGGRAPCAERPGPSTALTGSGSSSAWTTPTPSVG